MLVGLDMKNNLADRSPVSVRRAMNVGQAMAGVTLASDGSLERSQLLPHMEPLS